jgi:hypothetical protein
MITVLPKDANRAILFCFASFKLMKGALRRPRIFEKSKPPIRMGGKIATPRRAIAREIEEMFLGQG